MYVVDTNVISEFIKPTPETSVMSWLVSTPRKALFLPSIVVAELYLGIELLSAGKRRDALIAYTDAFIESGGPESILPFAEKEARVYAQIGAYRRRIGRPIKQHDMQIAAIAVVKGMSVVTRNVRDFEHCGVDIINPWEPS